MVAIVLEGSQTYKLKDAKTERYVYFCTKPSHHPSPAEQRKSLVLMNCPHLCLTHRSLDVSHAILQALRYTDLPTFPVEPSMGATIPDPSQTFYSMGFVERVEDEHVQRTLAAHDE